MPTTKLETQPCAGCGKLQESDSLTTCCCGLSTCRDLLICDSVVNVPGCHYTVVCEQCKVVLLKSHGYRLRLDGKGDDRLCQPCAVQYESYVADPSDH